MWNRGNLDFVEIAHHPDYVLHSPAETEPIRGHEGYRAFAQRIRDGFPDVRVTVEDVVADGDQVVGRLTMRMTHTGPYVGIPPTGRRVETTQMVWARFEDGLVREAWQEVDALGVVRQLGVVPPPEIGPLGLIGWAFATVGRLARAQARARRRR